MSKYWENDNKISSNSEVQSNNNVQNNIATTNNESYDGIYPYHEPLGKGIGVNAGRVSWIHNKDSVKWNGEGYWWNLDNYNEDVILNMVNNSIISLSGEENIQKGWEALFKYFNNEHNKGNVSYREGEKIVIKANINGSAVMDDDTSGNTNMSYTNPVLLKALLISLVEEVGIKPQNITVYDVSRKFPEYMIKMCTEGILNGINFIDRDSGKASDVEINWSYKFSGKVNYIPTIVTEADYLINLANLKGHSYGITLTAKNHFGSFINGNTMRPPEGANLHQFLTKNEMNTYSPLTDLTANREYGGKTLLYMLDAIICATSEGSSITKSNSTWVSSPFDNYYSSSILVSQDPVAIDSVGADILMNEPTIINNNSSLKNNPNVENYLHESALIDNSPSGTTYYDGFGNKVTNLGVHEHWNNSKERLYSRNLGKNEGIELIYINI